MSLQRRLQLIDTTNTQRGPGGERMSLRVAFATTDRKRVDQHFGSAEAFVLYDVNECDARMVGVGEFGALAQDGNEAKLVDKLDLLDGCDAVYCQAVGHSAVQQLLARGVQPIKVPEGTPIADLLGDLREDLGADEPPTWLARLRRQKGNDRSRFDAMEEEGWEE